MSISRLLMILLFITSLPGVAHAGQSEENGTKGAGPEPECDTYEDVGT
jgi:hypothetical protein